MALTSITAAVIIPAAGSGRRMGLSIPKQFQEVAGVPLLVHTVKAFQAVPAVQEIILVVPPAHIDFVRDLLIKYRLLQVSAVVPGGARRQDSVKAGLHAVSAEIEVVIVHDGARPLVSPGLISACIAAAHEHGAAMVAVPVKDTLKAVTNEGWVEKTVDRTGLWQAQTPQAVRADLLREAFRFADDTGFSGTDEASLLEHLGHPVRVVSGAETNIKVTRPDDLQMVRALLGSKEKEDLMNFRIGMGYDAHQLVPERPLILGGMKIPHALGLLGHSDADVLVHSLCDALLGALGEGDIGRHFPDQDPGYKDISSLVLLERVASLVQEKGFRLVNADITVIAERPKLSSYFPSMQENLARVCKTERERINLKATTTEAMGFEGRQEGISAQAVVLLAGK